MLLINEMIRPVLTAIIPIGIIGLIFGLLLAYAGKIFAVKVDERLPKIIETLPGINCGVCGYAGCSAYASEILNGAPTNKCTVGGNETAQKVAEIMGVNVQNIDRKRAHILCNGTNDFAKSKFYYRGINDCITASKIGGGEKECPYGCLGLGNCIRVCPYDAIKTKNGIAVVDYEKCTGCGLCVSECPKNLIELIPYYKNDVINCISKDKGLITRGYCTVGCIGCGICVKNCPVDAITMEDNIAKIDYEKCTGCGICVQKCPRKTIWKGDIKKPDKRVKIQDINQSI